MRIQLASDLHLEQLEYWFPGARTISPAHGADVLVLAGDIGKGTNALNLFRDWPALVAITFIGTAAARFQPSLPDTSIAYAAGQLLGVLAVGKAMVWFVVRKSSELTKARGWLLVAVLALLGLGGASWSDHQEKSRMQAATAELREARTAYSRRHDELNTALAALPWAEMSKPTAIVDPVSRKAVLAALNEALRLIDERRALFGTAQVEPRRIAVGHGLDVTSKQWVDLEADFAHARSQFEKVDAAQVRFVRAFKELLIWAEGQSPRELEVDGAKVVLNNAKLAAEYNSLSAVVDSAAAAQLQVMQETRAFRAPVR